MNNQNPDDVTVDAECTSNPLEAGTPAEHPRRIGRYQIERLLGKGGFGLVYLAYDEQLNRRVAVKVPHAKLISKPEDAEAYLVEARTVANLDHPGIVPVHDVGSTQDCPCYVVSKYIEGCDLSAKLRQHRLTYRDAVELVAAVAEALHCAHKQGLVHRDVKPSNILIGKDNKPYVVDFGLALREENIGKGPKYAGTPAYMSPEQARGEGHRVDGRSDVFSLGVVFYELLAGRRPFRGDTQVELLEQVTSYEARPLRQYDEKLPKELERICHKAMSKRASERYSSAHDMAEDLRHFLLEHAMVQSGASPGGIPSVASQTKASAMASAAASTSVASGAASSASIRLGSSDGQPIKIVPRGLRSFDAHDADFFLELLPGPRDREGLPDSLRFWKTRIEETDPDNTFSVGLIYGPSGCGKSSLVKAGLLPRLSEDVIAVYIEATPEETETRLLHGLRKRCPASGDNLSLKDTLAALRRGQGIPNGRKVLIVLDQFEQWLHAKKEEENTDLVQALRQCDAGRVQCIVMVRDDFWMAATRFMRELEVRLIEGQNSAAVDLFPIRHAEKVLAAFGRAFGVLPDNLSDINNEQKSFLKQSVADLAEEGKVICVRLALFAEMMKGKAWTPTTLKEVGGTKGVGVTFLEETFSASTSPPEHRHHQAAARAVLRALLPGSGTDIKGEMKSRDELLAASGYANRPKDFEDLIRILDSEIRLITPTDPEGVQSIDGERLGVSPPCRSMRYYQLAHDYLVPSLRDWLTRKQRETRRGRAELKLAERSALWTASPENRYLPSLAEWLSFRTMTESKHWTAPQRAMIGRAGRVHGLRTGLATVLLLALAFTGFSIRQAVNERQEKLLAQKQEEQNQAEAMRLVEGLLAADTLQVSTSLTSMKEFRIWADPHLQQAFKESAADSNAKLHAGLALAADGQTVDSAVLEFLQERLLTVTPAQFAPVRQLLEPHKAELIPAYWKLATDDQQPAPRRFHAACALAEFDPETPSASQDQQSRPHAPREEPSGQSAGARWNDAIFTRFVAEQLVTVSPEYIGEYEDLLRPIAPKLIPALTEIFKDSSHSELARSLAVSTLADFAKDDPERLAELILTADVATHSKLFLILQRHQQAAVANLESVLARTLESKWADEPLDAAWNQPSPAARAQVESAHGLIADRFAFCQDMPLPQFLEVTEALRTSGYRPTRVRPWQTIPARPLLSLEGEKVADRPAEGVPDASSSSAPTLIAAIWTRDHQRWELQNGLARTNLPAADAPAAKDGMLLTDVGVLSENLSSPFIALWSDPLSPEEQRRVLLDVTDAEFTLAQTELTKQGFGSQCTMTVRVDAHGRRRYTGIWSNQGAPSEFRPAYAGFELVKEPQWDVAVAPAGSPANPLEKIEQNLARIEAMPAEKLDDLKIRETRAQSHFLLGNLEPALADFDYLISKDSATVSVQSYRTRTLARMGHREEAMEALAKYLSVDTTERARSYVQIQVSAWLGDFEQASAQLESAATTFGQSAEDLYNVACAAALASQAAAGQDAAQAEKFADRAVELLQQTVALGYGKFAHLKADADLASLYADPGFLAWLNELEPPANYSAVWRADSDFESILLGAVPMESVLDRIKPLIAAGYRPAAIAIAPTVASTPNEVSAAELSTRTRSVAHVILHRPIILDAEREQLALQQAAAAITLLHLNAADNVWPLFQDQPDPRLRSYVLHRLAAYGVDRQSLITQLQNESDASRQRSLILGLGEFARAGLLSPEQQAVMIADLTKRYADDPEPGIHGAAEWTLRQLGAEAAIAEVRAAYSTGTVIGERRWYLTKTGSKSPATSGITFSIMQPEKEFLMGAPVTETERTQGPTGKLETRHRRRVGHRYAIGTHEITVAQFSAFHSNHPFERSYAREEDAPANMILWYDAAAYCNWLSREEGLPREQWCYDPDQPFAEGMTLVPDYLQRTGYRLPSEAEWEYACRAGTTTARYFGQTETLLGDYAWYTKSSGDKWMLPVGTLRPNGAGLFDMQGNVNEWCQDKAAQYDTEHEWIEDEEQSGRLINANARVLRGGSFNFRASEVRSAKRLTFQPDIRVSYYGFRVARTLLPVASSEGK